MRISVYSVDPSGESRQISIIKKQNPKKPTYIRKQQQKKKKNKKVNTGARVLALYSQRRNVRYEASDLQ